jgi:lysophosphatidate acyltransferase
MSWLLYALGLPPALAFLLFAMSKMLPQKFAQLAQFVAFCVASVFFMCVSALYGVFVAIPLRALGYGGCIQWTVGRVFKWCMWWSTGVIFEIIDSGRVEGGRRGGEEALQTRPAVFVGNHQTELDVLMLGTVFPKYCSVTAKKSLKWMPFLGWFSMPILLVRVCQVEC